MIDRDLLISLEQIGINEKVSVRFKDKQSYEKFIDFLNNNGNHDNYDFTEETTMYISRNGKTMLNYTLENDKNIFVVELLWQVIQYLKDDNNVQRHIR